MDIVSRIKAFMASGNISSTQFADACNIPRPTLSQILGGRNKKISDEVISKIHEAYPRLSVMWLLFGEGEMITSQNIQFSAPQNQPKFNYESAPSNQSVFGDDSDVSDSLFSDRETSSDETLIFGDDESADASNEEKNDMPPVVHIPADGSKSIVNIMVFYSDNSYQSFVPR
ncbi:MAG: helix-turn-helix domain-containing protein [Muribaculaceae bacterium]|nr:helix-turn-helix domain-containing protein [Muribaculaceae bacterium]